MVLYSRNVAYFFTGVVVDVVITTVADTADHAQTQSETLTLLFAQTFSRLLLLLMSVWMLSFTPGIRAAYDNGSVTSQLDKSATG